MKDRIAYFKKPPKDQEKILTFRNGDHKEEISCLDKKYFDDKNDKDKIVGYVHLKNKKYSGKEYGTLEHAFQDKMDVYSKKKIWERVTGYIRTTEDEYLGVTRSYLLPLLLLIAALIIGVGLYFVFRSSQVLPPDFSQVAEEEQDDCNCDITAKVILPDGIVSFDGTVYTPEAEKQIADGGDTSGTEYPTYTGEAIVTVTAIVNDGEHLLIDTTKVAIEDGKLPDITIDFTKLDFELTAGIYYGYVTITYSSGATVVKPIKIVIYDSSKGSVGIGYSNQIYVYPAEDRISLKYECDDATTDTIVQIIVKSGNDEILLAQSGIVHSGDLITELPLDSDAKEKLQTGSYNGVMRVYFDDTADKGTTSLKTDIDCTINVQ